MGKDKDNLQRHHAELDPEKYTQSEHATGFSKVRVPAAPLLLQAAHGNAQLSRCPPARFKNFCIWNL